MTRRKLSDIMKIQLQNISGDWREMQSTAVEPDIRGVLPRKADRLGILKQVCLGMPFYIFGGGMEERYEKSWNCYGER